MNPYAFGIVISVLIYLMIGSYVGRQVKGLEDYYVAGRDGSTLLIAGTLVASYLSTAAFLGETGFTYQGHGAILMILVAINIPGYVVGAIFFGRYVRRSRAITVAEFFGKRFNSRRVQLAAGITVIAGVTAYLLAVTQGAALAVSEVMDIRYDVTLLIVWLGYTSFTIYAGSKGVILTDTVMYFLFTFVGFLSLYYILTETGGWFTTIKSLAIYEPKPGILSWHGLVGPESRWQTPFESVGWGIVLGISWAFTIAVSPWQSSRYLMAKNEHTIIRSACFASVSIVGLYWALVVSAAAINLLNPDISPNEKAMIWASFNAMPTYAGVLLMSGVVAAALSSASTFLSLIGFSATNDLMGLGESDELSKLRLSRLTMLVIGIVILIIAYFQPPAIMMLTYFAATLFASSWGPVAFMSVWSNQITADGAFWGIIVGFFGNLVPKVLTVFELIALPNYLDPFVIGIALSFVTIVVVSRQGTVTGEEHRFRLRLHDTNPTDFDESLDKGTLWFAKGLMLSGLALTTLMMVFYVFPFHQSLRGSANWGFPDLITPLLSGESVLAFGYGGILFLCGAFTHWWIKTMRLNR